MKIRHLKKSIGGILALLLIWGLLIIGTGDPLGGFYALLAALGFLGALAGITLLLGS